MCCNFITNSGTNNCQIASSFGFWFRVERNVQMDQKEYAYLSTNVILLTFIGCYPLDKKNASGRVKKLYFAWRFVLVCALISLAVCITADLCKEKFDFTKDGQKVGHLGVKYGKFCTGRIRMPCFLCFRDLQCHRLLLLFLLGPKEIAEDRYRHQ